MINIFLMDSFKISAITTPAYSHNLTQKSYRIGLMLLPDKAISYIESLEKRAAVFCNISPFILSRLISLHSFCSYSFSAVIFPFPGKAPLPSDSNWFFQGLRTPGWIPRLREASEILYPCSITRLTASFFILFNS